MAWPGSALGHPSVNLLIAVYSLSLCLYICIAHRRQIAKSEARSKQAQASGDAEMAAFDGPSPMQHTAAPLGVGEDDEGGPAAVDGGGDVTMRSPKRRRSDKGPPMPQEGGDHAEDFMRSV